MRLSALDLLLMIAAALIVVGVVGMARAQEHEYPGYYCGSHDCQLHADATSKFAPIPAQTPDFPAWGKAYHTCGTFGASDDDCDPPKSGSLYAFCDTDWPEVCNQKALMLKDACEQTVEIYGGGDPRFSCALVDDATRDAYLKTLDPDMRERTIEAWAAGR